MKLGDLVALRQACQTVIDVQALQQKVDDPSISRQRNIPFSLQVLLEDSAENKWRAINAEWQLAKALLGHCTRFIWPHVPQITPSLSPHADLKTAFRMSACTAAGYSRKRSKRPIKPSSSDGPGSRWSFSDDLPLEAAAALKTTLTLVVEASCLTTAWCGMQ